MKVFADTSFLIALYDNTDEYSKSAHKILKSLKDTLQEVFISDYIFDETVTLLLDTHHYYGYLRAKAFNADVTLKKVCHLTFISEILFEQARDIFFRYNKDKSWSFTDCTSFALMKDFDINRVLSFDKHFSEMGFKLLA